MKIKYVNKVIPRYAGRVPQFQLRGKPFDLGGGQKLFFTKLFYSKLKHTIFLDLSKSKHFFLGCQTQNYFFTVFFYSIFSTPS